MQDQLPPGPRMPSLWQTLGFWNRPTAFLERCRRRYGPRFTVRLLGSPPFVMISDPEEIKQVFMAPPDVLHPGEGARILEPIVGRHSVILLDEEPHLEQRKLLLPAFHGESMQRLAGLMAELTDGRGGLLAARRADRAAPAPAAADAGDRAADRVRPARRRASLDRLREPADRDPRLRRQPAVADPGQPAGCSRGRGPWARLERAGAQADELIYELIDERRRDGGEGDDVLALLLSARHGDETEMSAAEIRDELMTALVAGHETTASQLAWAFERLAREPAVRSA